MSKNNKISAFQFGTVVFLLGGAQVLSGGVNGIIRSVGTNAWLVPIISIIYNIIPILLLIFIGNYKPELNIFEKNKHIFGNIIGTIINGVMALYVLANFTLGMWTLVNFATIKYLGLTPSYFIGFMVIIPVIYAMIKGFETTIRTIEFSFFQNLFFTIIILILLSSYIKIDNIKPILENGLGPVLNTSFMFSSFNFVPISIILVIRKNSLAETEKYGKYFIIFALLSMFYYTLVFIAIIGSIGVYIASLYVYPEYYVLKEINFIGYLENVENILAFHWFFFLGANLLMSAYYLIEYFKSIFNKAKERITNIYITVICIIIVILQKYLFKNITESFSFIRYNYKFFALAVFILYVVIFISIKIKKRTEKF